MYYFGKVIDMYKICVSSCFKIVEITMSITYIYDCFHVLLLFQSSIYFVDKVVLSTG